MSAIRYYADTSKAIERVDKMLAMVEDLPAKTSETFMRWQVNDMNRNKPHVVQLDADSFLTHFWNRPWRLRKKV